MSERPKVIDRRLAARTGIFEIEEVDGLLAMADFSEARSALAVFLAVRFLGGVPGTAAVDRCSEV